MNTFWKKAADAARRKPHYSRIVKDEADAPRLASPAQASMYARSQIDPDDPQFNTSAVHRFEGALEVSVLKAAIQSIAQRHSILSSRFNLAGGDLRASPSPEPADLEIIELDEERALEEVAREIRRPFDLAQGPLSRFRLFDCGEGKFFFSATIHHLASDGWSFRVLQREIEAGYRDALDPRRPRSTDPEISYWDWAAWYRAQERSASMRWWSEHLRDPPEPACFHEDHKNIAALSAADRFGAALDLELTRGLHGLVERSGSTLHAVLLSALFLLLHEHTGRTDLIIGTPSPHRGHPQSRDLIGLFVNTLPIRARIDPRASFLRLLEAVQTSTFDGYAHEDLPFAQIVRAAAPSRAGRDQPLFRVLFAMEAEPLPAIDLPRVKSERVTVDRGTLTSDLVVTAVDDTSAIRVEVAHRRSFRGETGAHLAAQLEHLLREIVRDPAAPAGALECVPARERETSSSAWITADLPLERVHERIAARAAETPAAISVVDGDRRVTYGELELRARAVAAAVAGHGPFVPLLCDEGFETVAAIYGVIKSGCAFVPLAPSWPLARIEEVLRDIGARVLVTDGRSPSVASQLPIPQLVVADLAARETSPPSPPIAAGNPIYVMYTSGSTGRPKGVVIPHRGIENRFAWMDRTFSSGVETITAQTTRTTYDSSVWQILWPLTLGGRAVTPFPLLDTAEELAARVDQHRISVLDLVPSVLDELLQGLLERQLASSFRALRHLIVGGEEVHPATMRAFLRVFPEVQAWNLYGPTEATIGCVFHRIRPDDDPIPIGRPIPNVRAVILNDRLKLAPRGAEGELYLGGPCLALEYLNDRGATADSFIPNPISELGVDHLYRTGDRARIDAGGNLLFLGRTDRQVKIRGFRVELGEIESVLLEHPRVRAASAGVAERPGAQQIWARVVPREGASLDVEELAAHARARLLPHAVPSFFEICDHLPRQESGKVARSAPRETEPARTPPATPAERALAEIWSEILQARSISAEDDFFLLGGHSLSILRLSSRIRERLDAEVPIQQLFASRTLRAQARAIAENAARSRRWSVPYEPPADDGEAAITHQERRLWFLERLSPGAHHIQVTRRVRGLLNLDALRAALQRLIERHQALRFSLEERRGEPVRVVREAPRLALEEEALEMPLEVLLREECRRPFDLSRDLLLRARCLRLDGSDHVLVLTFHHLIADGASLGIIGRELGELYDAAVEGRGAILPPLRGSYLQYAGAQRARLGSAAGKRELEETVGRLRGASMILDLPLDHPRPRLQSFEGASVCLRLGAELSARVRRASAELEVTPFVMFLGAFVALLHRYTGQDDILIGTPAANRRSSVFEGAVGNFANTLVLRSTLTDRAQPLLQLLFRVRHELMRALEYSDVPFERVVEELNPPRDLGSSPIFQSLFSTSDAAETRWRLAGLETERLNTYPGHTETDLSLHVEDDGEQYSAWFVYVERLFECSTIERLAGHYSVLLRRMIDDLSTPVERVPMISARERRAAIEAGRGPIRARLREESVLELFDRSAAARPAEIAVSCEAESVTYGELRERSIALGRTLVEHGVGRGSIVAVKLPRSPAMITAILATLRAGAAYLPIDPSIPDERLAAILESSSASALIGEEMVDLRARGQEPAHAPARPSRSDLAYVIYTSGSTGEPKGVAVEHAALLNLLDAASAALACASDDVWTCLHSPSFDLSIFEYWSALASGARLVMVPECVVRDPPALVLLLHREQVTRLSATPTALGMMLDAGLSALSLRSLVAGGEVLSGQLAKRALEIGAPLWNFYGPAEATVWSSFHRVREDDTLLPSIPLGSPLANTSLHLLDDGLEPVPAGVTGELWIGGAGLARGYWRRPDLTDRSFAEVELEPGRRERMYRTGDLARRLSGGTILFLGRCDRQIKLRGNRIELDEIESVLSGHPAIKSCVVFLQQGSIEAFCVVSAARPVSEVELRRFLAARLPSYMIPSQFWAVESIPTNRSAKLDRSGVSERRPLSPEPGVRAPSSAAEKKIASIIEGILGRSIGMDENFFEAGGHSIAALRTIARINEDFRVALALDSIFETPTVESLVAAVARAWGDATIVEEIAEVLLGLRQVPEE